MDLDIPWDHKSLIEKDLTAKESDIAELRNWIKGLEPSSVVPKDLSDQLLLCFHNACKLIVEDTKKCIKTCYSIKSKAPELFDDRDMSIPIMKEISQVVEYGILPEKSNEGFPIIYHGLFDGTPEKYLFSASAKMFLMTTERCLLEHGPIKEVIFLLDMKKMRLGHLTRFNLSSMAKFFSYIQEGMPVRIHKLLIINAVPFVDKVMTFMKPFMKKELVSLFNFFPPNMDMDTFYRDVLPKRCLPSNFGGDLPDIATLNKVNLEKLIALKPYFEAEEKHRHLYTKKSKKKSKLEDTLEDLLIE